MISVENLTVRFGDFELFSKVSLMINHKDKIGLVGKNGAGKTTLLNVFAKLTKPSEGSVSVKPDVDVGYLPQQMKHSDSNTVFKEAEMAFEEIIKLNQKIHSVSKQIESRTDFESDDYLKLINQITDLSQKLEILGGDNYHADIEQVLIGLGFKRSDFNRSTKEFSGGWRMRIELAKILLKKPDVLLLDEPTNHLDIESIQWLENFVIGFNGAMILISHDRAFLDNTTNRTLEISLGKIYDYKAPYSKFVELRKDRREKQLAAYNNQQKMIADTQKFIDRFRYKATKAVQVQARIKQLEKIDRIEVEQEDKSAMNLSFPPAPRAGSIVVEAENLSKSYGNNQVLHNIDFVIERGEKVAFVGKNGEGKTTLSRIIVGELEYDGLLKPGHNLKIGYFAQNQDEIIDDRKTVFETIDNVAVGDIRAKIRDILGAFLFSGDDIDKKVSVLSGGERSRLALAKLLLEPYNLLVLDEPTNHLDMKSKEILKNALIKYDGTIVIVSHDRDFLSKLCNKVYEFNNKKIRNYPGDIYEFLKLKKIESLKELEKSNVKNISNAKKGINSKNKQQYLDNKEKEKKIRKYQNRLKQTEEIIESLEKEIQEMDMLLASPEEAGELMNDNSWFEKYEKYKKELQSKMSEWEDLCISLEKMNSNE